MADDDKALVERLRDVYRVKVPNYIDDAADRIEALSKENDRLKANLSIEAKFVDKLSVENERKDAEIERLRKYVLMWLGVYRDDLSQDAIKNLQVILGAALGEAK